MRVVAMDAARDLEGGWAIKDFVKDKPEVELER